MTRPLLMAGLLFGLATSSLAAEKTVTLSVPGMYCAVCPVTVKKALTQVRGVSRATVNYEKREAVVTYDDAQATVETLARATEQAGYPSKPLGLTKGAGK